MKKLPATIAVICLCFMMIMVNSLAQEKSFPVIIDKVINGKISLDPAPPENGMYTAGTVITVKATPVGRKKGWRCSQ